MKNHKVPADISAKIRVMHQCYNLKHKKLLEDLPKISKASVYKHTKKSPGIETVDKKKSNTGLSRKITEELKRRCENKNNQKTSDESNF